MRLRSRLVQWRTTSLNRSKPSLRATTVLSFSPIHQPQSNIVALFDRLVLLAKGQLVYSGEAARAAKHFAKLGYTCPEGYNIADYLIDVTVEAAGEHRINKRKLNGNGSIPASASASRAGRDAENGFASGAAHEDSSIDDSEDDTREIPESDGMLNGIKRKAQQLLGAFTSSSSSEGSGGGGADERIPEKLASIVLAHRASDDAKIVEAEIHRIQNGETPGGMESTRDVATETALLKGYTQAGFWSQFKLLSGRAFKNLYRWVTKSSQISPTPVAFTTALCGRSENTGRRSIELIDP